MFCPGCGLEEIHSNQFCRACGTDLRHVRVALEKPDNITASAVSARDEIGRAIAAKIRAVNSAEELSVVVEDVLPEIEKFLESPEEKRLRGIRQGVIVSSIGVGAAIAFFFASFMMGDKGILMVAGAGVVTLFVGLSLIVNAMLFSTPGKSLPDESGKAARQRELDAEYAPAGLNSETNELLMPPSASNESVASVTEHTTHRLKGKQPAPRR